MIRRRDFERGGTCDGCPRNDAGSRTSLQILLPTATTCGKVAHRKKQGTPTMTTLSMFLIFCMCMILQIQFSATDLVQRDLSVTTVEGMKLQRIQEPKPHLSVTAEGLKLQQPQESHPISKLTLVTSFFAQPENQPRHAHRVEIEAALAANLANPHIDQVVVVLDSVSHESECGHFLQSMEELRQRANSIWEKEKRPILTCIPKEGAQPNYFEMFNYTLHEKVEGDVVILSNADQVFDDTVAMAKTVPPKTLWTLSTWGYDPHLVPTTIQWLYNSLVGIPTKDNDRTEGRCTSTYSFFSQDLSPVSWDTYIFHPSLIREHLQSEAFLRNNYDGVENPFYMNEMGAEGAALFAVANETSFSDEISLWNACPIIQTWHFHLTSKTHRQTKTWPPPVWMRRKNKLPSEYVPAPRVNAPMCHMTAECMLRKPMNVQKLAQSQSMKGKKQLRVR